MRAFIHGWIVYAGVAWAGVALAGPRTPRPTAPRPSVAKPSAPKADARAKHKLATQLSNDGDYQGALAAIEEGLAIAPKDQPLLFLKGTVLLSWRDYPGALAAYQAYVAIATPGATKHEAEQIVKKLLAAPSTFLDITVANGPAAIYLDSKTDGAFCTAAPSCNKSILPGDYKIIGERPGFDRWTGRATVQSGKTAKLDITLVELPSLLTVRVAQPGAHITVDDAAYEAPAKVAAGKHRVVVSLAGHVEARLDASAHEGKPVALDVALTPLVPIQVEPPGAQLVLDDKPAAIEGGGIAVSPGPHVLVARAQGFREGRVEIPAERAADYKLSVELVRIPLVAAPPAHPGRFTTRRKIALAAGGVGLLAATGGVVLGLSSRQLDHDAFALCPSASTPCAKAREANDLNRRGQSRAHQANIAYGVAGAAAVAAAILWFTGAPESPGANPPEPRVAITPHLGPLLGGVAGLDFAVRF